LHSVSIRQIVEATWANTQIRPESALL